MSKEELQAMNYWSFDKERADLAREQEWQAEETQKTSDEETENVSTLHEMSTVNDIEVSATGSNDESKVPTPSSDTTNSSDNMRLTRHRA